MKIALFGKQLDKRYDQYFHAFLDKLRNLNCSACIYEPLLKSLSGRFDPGFLEMGKFKDKNTLENCQPDYLVSFGGDGTFLDAVTLIGSSGIPVLGINSGRLGFLSGISIEDSADAIDKILNKDYSVEKRSLISLQSNFNGFGESKFALNEFTIHKRDTSSMLTIRAYLNGELLNIYWSDGLVIATPTGSTAYSLSCGGPVVFPYTQSFVVTPVASHNIAIRPLILPDDSELSFEVEGRGKNFLVSLDSRYEIANYNSKLSIKKADFYAHLVKLSSQSFISTLREKLMLGIDNRNA